MTTTRVRLFDKSNIDTLILPKSEIANLVKSYWIPLIKSGSSTYISNINTHPLVIALEDMVLTVTVNSQEMENSYVCSVYSHYITYAQAELAILHNPLLEKSLKQLLKLMGVILQWGRINQVVIVNNWLLSTNLYPNLSNDLYLIKYYENNPQFSQLFVELALKNGGLQIHALRKDGKIDGVVGFYQLNGMMTTPFFGYDTQLPQDIGLYRMLSALLTIIATKKGIILNQSSGAAAFKRFRGAVAHIEYSAVFYRHLPIFRQFVWRLLGLLVNQIAIPIMIKYQL